MPNPRPSRSTRLPKAAATTRGWSNESFFGALRKFAAMMTFIMSEPSKPHGGAAPSPLPRQALEALSGTGLAGLVERARWLAALDPMLRRSLPATLAGQCRLANVDENKLVFLVSSQIGRAKLRLHADTHRGAAAAAWLR